MTSIIKKKQLFCWIYVVLLSSAFLGKSADIYVSQSGTGDGTTSSNASSLAWLNSNWSSINAGDTVHLVGTLTNTLAIGKSGAAGSPITLFFEPNAKFSAPAWGSPASDNFTADPIVQGGGVSTLNYFIIDGGSNGLITSTSNGMGQSFSNSCVGLVLTACGMGVEIRNLTVTNMYYRITGAANDFGCGNGIEMSGTVTNCSIHNCTVINAGNAFAIYYEPGISSNLQIYSNAAYHISWGCVLAPQQNNATCVNSSIWANRFDHFEDYAGNPGYHQDGIICYTALATQTNRNLQIYRNLIGPHISTNQTTAAVFINDTQAIGSFQNVLIYDNIFMIQDGDLWGNGFVAVDGNPSCVFNNTFVETGILQGGICFHTGSFGNASFMNNLALNVNTVLAQGIGAPAGFQPTIITNSDYNVVFSPGCDWWNPGSFTWGGGTSYRDHVTYPQFANFDNHSSINQPLLNANYQPLTNDTVVINAGINLSSFFAVDFNGNPRPATGPWTIGAFQTTGAASTLQTVSPPSIISIGPGPATP